MNYVYDIVLNFSDLDNLIDFYEWNKEDHVVEVSKIPIFRIDRLVMDDFFNNKIKIDLNFLSKIKNETICNNNSYISYSCLLCDLNVVIAIKCDCEGNVIEKSRLLFDEEDFIIDSSVEYEIFNFSYKKLDMLSNNNFLTRRDKFIREYLINEITKLYNNNSYDELNYLYGEIYNDSISIKNKYDKLILNLKDNYSPIFEKLYDILMISCK